MSDLDVSVTPSPQWRTASGRFSRADVGGDLAKALQGWGSEALQAIKEATPVRTGKTRAGWRTDYRPTAHEIVLTNREPAALFLIKGTKPHTITAKPGGVLAFMIEGAMVFTREVHHPGTKPDQRLLDAIVSTKHLAKEELHQTGVRLVDQLRLKEGS